MPRMAKVHSEQHALELARLGWTLQTEFLALGDNQPYEYVFLWQEEGDPKIPDGDPNRWLGSGALPEPTAGRRIT
jgi:hypothetical protein